MKSKAAILWEVNTPWSVEETELDEPREGEVRVKLTASGLCHSDDHIVKGDLPTGMPIVGGHEGSGIVEAVGPGVRRLKEGNHVVMAFMPACGHCRWCASGLSMLWPACAPAVRDCGRCRCWARSPPTSSSTRTRV
jgi:S-(hydroxymethyl)glutathione dehydrogenase/alcohol dehydrogenase